MKLLIDSHPVDLPLQPGASFTEYCGVISAHLLDQNLAIANCKLNGCVILHLEEAATRFTKDAVLEIESVPLSVALAAMVSLRCSEMKRLEADVETLVTDSLIGEPEEVLRQWHSVCEQLKTQIRALPQLGALLADEQVEEIVSSRMDEFRQIMNACAKSLSTADVVAFSDTLEMQFLPWLRALREIIHSMLARIEELDHHSVSETKPK